MTNEKKKQVRCPECGYKMPIFYTKESKSKGLFIKCKGRKCGEIFEIRINVK